MNILLLLAHSIAEHDDLRMFARLGYDVFSIGAFTDPSHPGDDKRPPLPDVPHHPELAALVPDQMAAKAHLPDEIIDWADVIIAHHYVDTWLYGQWDRIRHKRVIWRTCGQSDPRLETQMGTLRRDGLQIVRYSPAERRYFEEAGIFAGEDVMIRFGKDLDDWHGWTGEGEWVGNVTQDMAGRGEWCGLGFWNEATAGLSARPAGPNSEALPGGIGTLTYDGMRQYLRECRVYLYTGTVPASYTLGLIEAMLTGTPVVAMGASRWLAPPELWEAGEIAVEFANGPDRANALLDLMLADHDHAYGIGVLGRKRARELFDVAKVGAQWVAFLGAP